MDKLSDVLNDDYLKGYYYSNSIGIFTLYQVIRLLFIENNNQHILPETFLCLSIILFSATHLIILGKKNYLINPNFNDVAGRKSIKLEGENKRLKTLVLLYFISISITLISVVEFLYFGLSFIPRVFATLVATFFILLTINKIIEYKSGS